MGGISDDEHFLFPSEERVSDKIGSFEGDLKKFALDIEQLRAL